MLLSLRTAVSSIRRGVYLRLDLSAAEELSEQSGYFQSRLETISASNKHGRLLEQVHEAACNNDDRLFFMPHWRIKVSMEMSNKLGIPQHLFKRWQPQSESWSMTPASYSSRFIQEMEKRYGMRDRNWT